MTASDRQLSMTDKISCTECARSFEQALEAGVTIANREDVTFWSTEDYPFDSPPPASSPKPPVEEGAEHAHVSVFDRSIPLDPSLWVDTMADCECIYCGLNTDLFEEVGEACLSARSGEEWTAAVTTVLPQLRDWKYDALSEAAIEHEATIAATFNLENPIRGVDEERRETRIDEVPPEAEEVLTQLRELSIEVLSSYYNFPLTLYRGLGHHLAPIAEDIFSDPSRQTYLSDTWESAAANFTPDPEIGCLFSEVALQVEVSEEAILIAPDFLTHTVVYYDTEDVWRIVTEGEIRLATDDLEEIDRESICAARATGTPLPGAVEDIPSTIAEYDPSATQSLSITQHRAVREAVLSFADFTIDDGPKVESVSPPADSEALRRIQTWLLIYEQEFYPDEQIDPQTEHVAEIVREILSAAGDGSG